MLEPHKCLEALEDRDIKQGIISKKIGVNQSTVSRIQNQLFKRIDYKTVERIQSLHKHVCIDNLAVDDFQDYDDKKEAAL